MNDSKVPISEEVAHWLIRLCHGDIKFDEWKQLTLFVREARRREAEKQGTPALKMIAVAQMLQFALGDCEHWGENEHGTAMMWWDVDFYDDELI